MMAQDDVRSEALEVVAIDIEASGIVDLRVRTPLRQSASTSRASWLLGRASPRPGAHLGRGRCVTASSKSVRTVHSRKSSGLWHPVLFRWNVANDALTVRLLGTHRFSG